MENKTIIFATTPEAKNKLAAGYTLPRKEKSSCPQCEIRGAGKKKKNEAPEANIANGEENKTQE